MDPYRPAAGLTLPSKHPQRSNLTPHLTTLAQTMLACCWFSPTFSLIKKEESCLYYVDVSAMEQVKIIQNLSVFRILLLQRQSRK